MKAKNPINKKVYFTLLAASVVAIVAVLPYAFTLQAEIIKQSPLPLDVLALISIVQSTILFAVALYIGLKVSGRIGLGAPVLENYFAGGKLPADLKSNLGKSVLLGILASALIIIFDIAFTYFGVSINLAVNQIPPLWQRLIATLYGGIGEEILLRLFLMALMIWLIGKITRYKNDIVKNNYIVWLAIILSATVFGLGHLPITANITDLTPLVIFRAILLNGIGGIIFGWLFWKKGLENAMASHFTADIVLIVIFPLITSGA